MALAVVITGLLVWSVLAGFSRPRWENSLAVGRRIDLPATHSREDVMRIVRICGEALTQPR